MKKLKIVSIILFMLSVEFSVIGCETIQIDDLKRERDSLIAAKSFLSKDLAEVRENAADQKARDDVVITQLKAQIVEHEKHITSIENTIDDLQARIEELGQKYRNARTNLAIETQEMALLLQNNNHLSMSIKEKDSKIEELRKNIEELKKKLEEKKP